MSGFASGNFCSVTAGWRKMESECSKTKILTNLAKSFSGRYTSTSSHTKNFRIGVVRNCKTRISSNVVVWYWDYESTVWYWEKTGLENMTTKKGRGGGGTKLCTLEGGNYHNFTGPSLDGELIAYYKKRLPTMCTSFRQSALLFWIITPQDTRQPTYPFSNDLSSVPISRSSCRRFSLSSRLNTFTANNCPVSWTSMIHTHMSHSQRTAAGDVAHIWPKNEPAVIPHY